MATPTHIPLATVTLSSSAAAVNFNSISQDYRDLVLVIRVTGDGGQATNWIICNDDETDSYPQVWMTGSGTSSSSGSTTLEGFQAITAPSTSNGNQNLVQIFDYSATDKHKNIINLGSQSGSFIQARAGRYPQTTAVTKLTVLSRSSLYASGSTFTLYGIAGVA